MSGLIQTSQACGVGVGGVNSLPQRREVSSSELRTAWMEGRQEQGLRGNMEMKLLTAPQPYGTHPHRPEILSGSLAFPLPRHPMDWEAEPPPHSWD